jgi:ribonuclease Z
MRPSFRPRLVNGPFDDPVLFIPLMFESRAVIFDLGEIYSLSTRDVLKISHVFVSHTHMDHFVGFDRLLRALLGREKTVYLYGPKGFIKNVEGKLAGYTWNLVAHYESALALEVTEVLPDQLIKKRYHCQAGFTSQSTPTQAPFGGVLHQEPAFQVSAVILDHGIPSLGFSIKERFHVNIKKDALRMLGMQVGPWLGRLKEALYRRDPPESEFEAEVATGPGKDKIKRKKFTLGDLADNIAVITPGQKVAYVTDAAYSHENVGKIVALARDADHLFIEAVFLEKDREIAQKKLHLTARQAGLIAARACVKRFTIFQFSPRYTDKGHLLAEEAMQAFGAPQDLSNGRK